MDKFMERAIRWLLTLAVCLPLPIFIFGLGPNLIDSGILGLITGTMIACVLLLGTIKLVWIVNHQNNKEDINAQ